MARRAENEILYEITNLFFNNCLISNRSLLWPDKSYWNLETLFFLKQNVIEAPLLGKDLSFEEKLEKQMEGASEANWAVICDIYFMYFLPSSYMKMEKIKNDIGWAAGKAGLILPDDTNQIWKSQKHGFTRTSMRYHTKYGQFWFIILLAIFIKEHESPKELLENNVALQQAMDMVLENIPNKVDRAYDMRHAILYMAFPDKYERSISTRDKQLIVDRYRKEISVALPPDLDESLLIIRTQLSNKHDLPNRHFDFYRDLKKEWRPDASTPPGVTIVDTDKGAITVPAGGQEGCAESSTKDASIHSEIQWLLLKLGNDMGLDVWVARNDRGKEINGKRFADLPRLKKALPLTFDELTNKTIELIDVLWLRQSNIMAAFEIESTTSIYSGILRMADLIAMQPNINIPLYIVAPDDRRSKVYSEINRPVFSSLSTPMNQICKYLSFSVLQQSIEKAGSMIKYLKPEFLDDIAEVCDLSEGG